MKRDWLSYVIGLAFLLAVCALWFGPPERRFDPIPAQQAPKDDSAWYRLDEDPAEPPCYHPQSGVVVPEPLSKE